MTKIESKKNLNEYMQLLNKEQSYRDKLLDLQLKKLLDDIGNAKKVKKIMDLLDNNQEQVKALAKSNNVDDKDANLISILDQQLFEMKLLLIEQENKLTSYKKAAENKLDTYKKAALAYKAKMEEMVTLQNEQEQELNTLKEKKLNSLISKARPPASIESTAAEADFAIKLGQQQRIDKAFNDIPTQIPTLNNPLKDVNSFSRKSLKSKIDVALSDITFSPSDSVEQTYELSSTDSTIDESTEEEFQEPTTDSEGVEIPELTNKFVGIKKHPDGRDDLTIINKISPKFEALLNANGITTITQIAEWTDQEVKVRDARLVFRGRISREKWVDQAKILIEKANK